MQAHAQGMMIGARRRRRVEDKLLHVLLGNGLLVIQIAICSIDNINISINSIRKILTVP